LSNPLFLAGPKSKYKLEGAKPADFWVGLWHGLISPISFIISVFNQNIRIYETNNVGIWYDFGFCIGAGIIFGKGAQQGFHH
jgi:hypothetical protein